MPKKPTEAEIKLFFVCAEDDDGENADVLVRAVDEEEARKEWRRFYKETWGAKPRDSQIKYVGQVPDPLTGPRGYIPWNQINPT